MLFVFSVEFWEVINFVLLQSAPIWILFTGKIFITSGKWLLFKVPIKSTFPSQHTHLFSVRLTPKILLLHVMAMCGIVLVPFLDIRRKHYFNAVISYWKKRYVKKQKQDKQSCGSFRVNTLALFKIITKELY